MPYLYTMNNNNTPQGPGHVTIYDRRPESINEEQARLIERLIKAGTIKNKHEFFAR